MHLLNLVRWRLIFGLTSFFFMWYTSFDVLEVFSAPAIAITTSTYTGYEPLTITGRITVEPHEQNRQLCLVWDSGEDGGSSCWLLEGEDERKTRSFTVRALPAGDYKFQAFLGRLPNNTIGSNSFVVRVISKY